MLRSPRFPSTTTTPFRSLVLLKKLVPGDALVPSLVPSRKAVSPVDP